MPKAIIKEVIIMLLLLLAIVLALGILFYDYIPISKVVPTVEEYQTSNTVAESLQNDILADTTKVIVTREIDGTDLSIYEQSKDYKKGKANPFESVVTTTNQTNTVQNTGTTNSGTTVNTNTNNDNNTNTASSNTNTNEASDENDYLSNTTRNNGSK